jgi:hypothetical protein
MPHGCYQRDHGYRSHKTYDTYQSYHEYQAYHTYHHRLSVVELARRAGVPERDLERVEAASGEMLTDTLSSIARALDVDVAVFFRPRANDVH